MSVFPKGLPSSRHTVMSDHERQTLFFKSTLEEQSTFTKRCCSSGRSFQTATNSEPDSGGVACRSEGRNTFALIVFKLCIVFKVILQSAWSVIHKRTPTASKSTKVKCQNALRNQAMCDRSGRYSVSERGLTTLVRAEENERRASQECEEHYTCSLVADRVDALATSTKRLTVTRTTTCVSPVHLLSRLLRMSVVLLLCLTLNTATTVAAVEGQQSRELLLPTIAQRHLLTRQQQRSFYSSEVVRLLNQRKNTSAALQYIEEAHDKWNRKQEPCHRANLEPFGIALQFKRNRGDSPRYHTFERAEQIAQRTADLLARLFQKSVPKHHKNQGGAHETERSSIYSALTSANLADFSNDHISGRIIVGSGIVIEDRGINIYAHLLGRNRRVQFDANYSYDSDESVHKCRWYDELEKRFSNSFSRSKHPQGIWSSPYYDCGFSDQWLITYGAPIIVSSFENYTAPTKAENETGKDDEFVGKMIGVATVSLNLHRLDMNQCPGDDPLFANTHLCDTVNSKCEFIPDKGFRRGNYRCRCLEGYYLPSSIDADPVINGHALEMDFVEKNMNTNMSDAERTSVAHLRCLPCPPGCVTCEDEAPCSVEYNERLRGSLVIAQLVCSCLVLLMMAFIYRLRKNRRFASSMWILLEAILLGAFFIYQGIVIRYFEPSAISCILEPWFREIGFSTLYGAISLKIYRIVAEFQTRKAHRVCVRSKDLLRYLIGLVLAVALYMTAWTAMVVDSVGGSVENILVNSTNSGLRFLSCRPMVWDVVTECAEIVFLILALRLAFRLRNAQSFPEGAALTRSIIAETAFSVTLYVLKHLFGNSVQPDYAFVAYFVRCHLTVTMVLLLIFLPKLCYRPAAPGRGNAKGGRAGQNQSRTAVSNESGMDPAQRLHQAIVGNGELDIAEISLADMDPEEIRAELRRAYTQLEVLRNKSMRRDNPHISKRRGGRKATHRRFSLQPFHHRHKHQQHSTNAGTSGTDHKPNLPETTEVSKTPENSTASMEGNFAADGPSVTSLSAERSAPSYRHHH